LALSEFPEVSSDPSHGREPAESSVEAPSRFDLRPRIFQGAGAGNQRWWLHLLLLAITLLSTTAVGARMEFNFEHALPAFGDQDFEAFWAWWSDPSVLVQGLPFSLTLLAILLAHECGHYVACLYYGIEASLPYFLPAPTFTGTLGAFIRIRSPIFSRRQLFDIGVAGPVAGFLFLLPAAGVGLAFSKVIPGIAAMGSLHFGTPLVLRWLEMAIFPGSGTADIYLHPIARAAWIGMFATALNLLPAGQLDGGHLIYALFGRSHKWVTRAVVGALVPIGLLFWKGWLLWAIVLFLFARWHPPIYDETGLGGARWRLGTLALALFVLCFTLAPVSQ